MSIDKTFTKCNLSIHQLTSGDFRSEIATLQLLIKHLPEMDIESEEINPTLPAGCGGFSTPDKNLKWLTHRADSIISILESLHKQSAKIEHAVRQIESELSPGERLQILTNQPRRDS